MINLFNGNACFWDWMNGAVPRFSPRSSLYLLLLMYLCLLKFFIKPAFVTTFLYSFFCPFSLDCVLLAAILAWAWPANLWLHPLLPNLPPAIVNDDALCSLYCTSSVVRVCIRVLTFLSTAVVSKHPGEVNMAVAWWRLQCDVICAADMFFSFSDDSGCTCSCSVPKPQEMSASHHNTSLQPFTAQQVVVDMLQILSNSAEQNQRKWKCVWVCKCVQACMCVWQCLT